MILNCREYVFKCAKLALNLGEICLAYNDILTWANLVMFIAI